MKYVISFGLLGGICLYYGYRFGWPWLPLGFNLALCWLGLSLAYLTENPSLLGKKLDGRLTCVSWLLYWPYVLLSLFGLRVLFAVTNESAVNKIRSSLYLGRRLSRDEYKSKLPANLIAVVDLTAEFPEPKIGNSIRYLCIPTLDTLDMAFESMCDAVRFVIENSTDGVVFIHCASGHGRSATIAAAVLIATEDMSPNGAVAELKSLRLGVGLHPEQSDLLDRYWQQLRASGREQ